MSASRYFIS